MTIPETYEFLQQPKRTEAEIQKLTVKRNALAECLLPAGTRYDIDKVKSSPSDRMSDIMAEVSDLDTEIVLLREEKAMQIRKVSLAITLLNGEAEQVALMAYYIGRIPVKRICGMIHYSPRGVYKVMRRGVKQLSERVV